MSKKIYTESLKNLDSVQNPSILYGSPLNFQALGQIAQQNSGAPINPWIPQVPTPFS